MRAPRTRFAAASGDLIVIEDADLDYDLSDSPVLLTPLLDGRADVVCGSRFLGGPHGVLYFWHYAGNRVTNLNLTDMEAAPVARDEAGGHPDGDREQDREDARLHGALGLMAPLRA